MNRRSTLRCAWRLAAASAPLAAATTASAQALAPVVAASTIAQDTAVAVCLAILTIAWSVAGYRVAFQGMSLRDVTGPILGGALAGGAAVIAGTFM